MEVSPVERLIPERPELTLRLAQAVRYWEGKRGDRLMPSRKDIDPTEIVDLLPFVMLIDVFHNPLDFRYRLIGTEIVSISRTDFTGLRYSELPEKGPGSVIWEACQSVVETRAPCTRVPPYIGPEKRMRDCGNVLLPLSTDDETVTMILKVVDFRRF